MKHITANPRQPQSITSVLYKTLIPSRRATFANKRGLSRRSLCQELLIRLELRRVSYVKAQDVAPVNHV
ncbi:hypothetical protein K439DRAFT_1629332 [Ramaria rubella]|nr:hypothetical protein K439DRAFT_1629332 [Ramaria rubella]